MDDVRDLINRELGPGLVRIRGKLQARLDQLEAERREVLGELKKLDRFERPLGVDGKQNGTGTVQQRIVAAAAGGFPDGFTITALREATGMQAETIRTALRRLRDMEVVEAVGRVATTGSQGAAPMRYVLIPERADAFLE